MFKIYVKEPNTVPPKDGIYYIIASNGTFIRKKTGFLESIVPVKGVPWLKFQKQEAATFLPKIPVKLMAIMLNFFKEVYQEHHSEVVVLLYYNKTEKTYLIDAPVQRVSATAVDYDSDARFEDYQIVGTIHNHSNFGAFHSGVDDADERNFDGVHITTGDILKEYPTISVSLVINGTRFKLESNQIIEGIERVQIVRPPVVTYTKKKKKKKGKTQYIAGRHSYFQRDHKPVTYIPPKSLDKSFQLVLPEEKTILDYPFDINWMNKVTKEKVVVTTYEGIGFQYPSYKPKALPDPNKNENWRERDKSAKELEGDRFQEDFGKSDLIDSQESYDDLARELKEQFGEDYYLPAGY